MKSTLERIFGGTVRAEARREVGTQAAKVVARFGGKGVARAVARTAGSPWLLAADGAELATEKVARALDCDEGTVKVASNTVGATASIGVGFAVGGPVGAITGLTLWGLGKGVEALLS